MYDDTHSAAGTADEFPDLSLPMQWVRGGLILGACAVAALGFAAFNFFVELVVGLVASELIVALGFDAQRVEAGAGLVQLLLLASFAPILVYRICFQARHAIGRLVS